MLHCSPHAAGRAPAAASRGACSGSRAGCTPAHQTCKEKNSIDTGSPQLGGKEGVLDNGLINVFSLALIRGESGMGVWRQDRPGTHTYYRESEFISLVPENSE